MVEKLKWWKSIWVKILNVELPKQWKKVVEKPFSWKKMKELPKRRKKVVEKPFVDNPVCRTAKTVKKSWRKTISLPNGWTKILMGKIKNTVFSLLQSQYPEKLFSLSSYGPILNVTVDMLKLSWHFVRHQLMG